MLVKRVATIARFALVLVPFAVLANVDCGSDNNNATGTAGSSGTAGHGGSTGTAGTSSGGSGGSSAGNFPTCAPVMVQTGMASILDFTGATGDAATFQFNGAMGGGTFIYPNAATETDLMGLTSSVA